MNYGNLIRAINLLWMLTIRINSYISLEINIAKVVKMLEILKS